MTTNARDEFHEKVRRTVAERAAYICSNPICRKPTVGPHSEPGKSLKTGIACHIHAAAVGGPRFNPNQTPEERRGIENAMWLCANCSALVDKDDSKHTAELLLEWKRQHEAWIADGGIIPKLPLLSLTTLLGRTLPETVGTITFPDDLDSKEHRLRFENGSATEISMIDARFQFPEPIVATIGGYIPTGLNVSWAPDRMQMMVHVTGSGSVTRTRPPMPTNIYRLQIDRVPANHRIEIAFLTSKKPFEDHDLSMGMPFVKSDPKELENFILGQFQFQYHGATLSRQFFAPIFEQDRKFTSPALAEDKGDWKLRIMSLFF